MRGRYAFLYSQLLLVLLDFCYENDGAWGVGIRSNTESSLVLDLQDVSSFEIFHLLQNVSDVVAKLMEFRHGDLFRRNKK